MQIVVFNSVTLDGVMQAPARADEDMRGGFQHGGWAVPYADADQGRVAGESMATSGALLLGRRTYEDFYTVWPHRTDNPFTEILNASTKYVASRTLREPLPWENSVLLSGDAADEVARLRRERARTSSSWAAASSSVRSWRATSSIATSSRSIRSSWAPANDSSPMSAPWRSSA